MKDIDYGKIIKRSWQLTWKNKWLWVMGIVLAAFGGGGSGSSGGSSGSSGGSNIKIPSVSPSPAPTNIQNFRNETSYVLGTATNFLKSWFMNISAGSWILLGLLILLFIVFSTAIVWILTSWAKGALITGLNIADMDQPVDLKNSSPSGVAKIKDLIIFKLISAGLTIAIVLGIAAIFGLGFLVKLAIPFLGIIWLVLFGIVGVLAFAVAMVFFTMLTIYAERLIVLKNISAWKAWKKGLSLGRHNFLPTLIMGFINSVIGCVSGCVGILALLLVFALPGALLIVPIFRNGFHFPGLGQIVGIVILLVLFITINLLIRAVFVVFDTGNWNLLFKEIYKEEKNE
jgi:hypothetical protein